MVMRVLLLAAVAIIALIIHYTVRSPSYRGKRGENIVSSILNSLPQQYHTVNNVLIPNHNHTSQIDHVVVSPYGIFVIETKNFSGWIFGSEKSADWKETFRTTDGILFRNPIKQNWGHVYALSEYLDLDKSVFRPIVVFSNNASLNVDSTTPVIYMSQLKKHILSYRQEVIPPEVTSSITQRLNKINLVGTDYEKKHVQSIRSTMAEYDRTLQNGKCPRCGGKLVLRNGRFGSFYGCSNYPKCRFTCSP